ncbi:MAG: hypothetical protein ACUVSM_01540 [Armatimonadota bacterium]
MGILNNPTALAIVTTAVLLLCALVLWAAVEAFRAFARFTRTAGETARELERLSRRLDEISGRVRSREPAGPGDEHSSPRE